MRKKVIFTITVCIVLIAVAVSAVSATYAIWVTHAHDSLFVATPVIDENPSLKYQIFVPVHNTQNEITMDTRKYEPLPGEFDFSQGMPAFRLQNSEDINSIDAIAVAGWFGGVTLEYIEIPAQISRLKVLYGAGGETILENLDVVSVLAIEDSFYTQYRLAGNEVIKSLIIGGKVEEMDKAVCYGMPNLERIEFKSVQGSPALCVREYAFAFCPSLREVLTTRIVPQDWDTTRIFSGSF